MEEDKKERRKRWMKCTVIDVKWRKTKGKEEEMDEIYTGRW
jgi:hypothetical protein